QGATDAFNEFYNSNTSQSLSSVDLTQLDAIGFHLVQASQPSDLVVSSIAAPASVTQGASYSFSYVVKNQGSGGATSKSWAAAYVDQQTTAFTNSWSQTDALAAGASQTQMATISTAGLSVGQHTLWIKADNFNDANGQFNSGNNDVVESDETNNWTS